MRAIYIYIYISCINLIFLGWYVMLARQKFICSALNILMWSLEINIVLMYTRRAIMHSPNDSSFCFTH